MTLLPQRFPQLFHNFRRDQRGAVAGEYAVLLTMVAVALVVALGLWAGALGNSFSAAGNLIEGLI
jgi:Flp pilus assembly pilin Flp